MRKFFLSVIFIMGISGFVNAQSAPLYFKDYWIEFPDGKPDFGPIKFNVKGYNQGRNPVTNMPDYRTSSLLFWDGSIRFGKNGVPYYAGDVYNPKIGYWLTQQNIGCITITFTDDGTTNGKKGFPVTSTSSARLWIKLADGRTFYYWSTTGPVTFNAGDRQFTLRFTVDNNDFIK